MRTDHQIQKDVIDQLNFEPVLNAAQIGVSVKNGVVTLSGTVDTYYKKTKAEEAVKKVAGVKALAEELRVGVSPFYKRSDTEIAEAVLTALKEHTSIPNENISVRVEDGIVTLRGQVDWYYQKKLAEESIIGIAGVREIGNAITVKPFVTAEGVKKRITDAIERNASLDAAKITVEIVGSKAVLRGSVRSLSEKEDAGNAAFTAPGVLSVENYITVREAEYTYEE